MKKQATTTSRSRKQTVLAIVAAILTVLLVLTIGIRILVPASRRNAPNFSQRPGFSQEDSNTQDEADSGSRRTHGSRPGSNIPAPIRAVRNAWLPIAAVLAVCDGVCIGMLLLNRKRQKAALADAAPAEDEDDYDEPPHRGGNQGFLIAALCVALAAVMIITSLPTAAKQTSSVNTRIITGTAEKNVISTVLSGAGTLTNRKTDPLTVPTVVELKEYYVHNGQTVAAGDILASVDKVSVDSAIVKLQEVMDELDKDLRTASNDKPSSAVKAPAPGRVMKIYAQKDDNVADVMYRDGALMLLSLDGTMAFDVSTDADISIGDPVTVTLDADRTADGRIAAYSDGVATVTIPDDAAALGDTATAAIPEGKTLGSGTLYVHSEVKITGYYGTVSNISVTEGAMVSAGRQVMTLKDTGHTAEYSALLERRYELEEQMASLFRLAQDGYLHADKNGIVSGIPEDAEFGQLTDDVKIAATAASGNEPLRVQLLTAGGDEFKVTLLGKKQSDEETLTATFMGAQGGYLILEGDADAFQKHGCMVMEGYIILQYDGPVMFLEDGKMTAGEVSELQQGDILAISFNTKTHEVNGIVTPPPEEANPDDTGKKDPDKKDDKKDNKKDDKKDDKKDNKKDDKDSKDTPTLPSMPSIRIPSGFGGMTTTQKKTPVYEEYDASDRDVITVTPIEDMTVTIQIDELDVLSLEVGLDAQITLDALKGQIFGGTITRIAKIGTNEGGNTKYAVEVTTLRTEQMLDGMNASVKIVTATSGTVTTVPAAALVEKGARTYVYTAYDEKTDTLSGLTEVTTGVSDGKIVEIVSGLDDGSAYCYRYADSIDYDFVQ